MKKLLLIASLLSGCAYHPPAGPTPAPVDRTAAATIVIDFVSGSGAKAGTAAITARVLNTLGNALPAQTVTFTTDTGALTPTQAVTDTDGRASTTLTASAPAHVTARTGSVAAESPIAVQPIVPSLPPAPPPVLTPVPTPAPPTPTPIPTLTLIVECTPAAAGSPTGCHAAMTDATGAPLTSTITNTSWDWGDGQVTVPVTSLAVQQHTYLVAGNYTVFVTAIAPATPAPGKTASTSIKVP